MNHFIDIDFLNNNRVSFIKWFLSISNKTIKILVILFWCGWPVHSLITFY